MRQIFKFIDLILKDVGAVFYIFIFTKYNGAFNIYPIKYFTTAVDVLPYTNKF